MRDSNPCMVLANKSCSLSVLKSSRLTPILAKASCNPALPLAASPIEPVSLSIALFAISLLPPNPSSAFPSPTIFLTAMPVASERS